MREIIDTTTGAGDNLQTGGDKLNRNLSQLFGGAAGARRPTWSVMGDSYGLAVMMALQWLIGTERYDIDLDPRTAANGGRGYYVPGVGAAHLRTTQLPAWQANPADHTIIWIGKNETINSVAAAQSIWTTNVLPTVTTILAAGGTVVLIGHGANGTGGSNAIGIDSFNNLMRVHARANEGVAFVETLDSLLDVATATDSSLPFRASASVDTVHPSLAWCRTALAPRLKPYVARGAGIRLPRNGGARAGEFDLSTAPDVNLIGDKSLMLTSSGGVATGFILSASGGIVAAPSIVTKADGFNAQRLTLSGATNDQGYQLHYSYVLPFTATQMQGQQYDVEVLLDFANVSGIMGVTLAPALVNEFPTGIGTYGYGSAHEFVGFSATDVMLTHPAPLTLTDNARIFLLFYVRNGATLSGTIDIKRMDVRRVA